MTKCIKLKINSEVQKMSFNQNEQIIVYDGKAIGSASGITFNIQRDIRPNYKLDSINPTSLKKGITIISGQIEFTIINQSVLSELEEHAQGKDTWRRFNYDEDAGVSGIDNQITNETQLTKDLLRGLFEKSTKLMMIDELPPVDLYIYNIEANDDEVTESGLNKKISMMKLQDLEFLNYSFNTSIQDIIGMESASFLALDYESYSTDLNSTQIGGE